jgi:hypothetical protein
MTFEYDRFSDTMLVSLSEPSSPCVYIEGETAGVLLRVEESLAVVRSFEISLWSRRISNGPVLIPEITDSNFQIQWLQNIEKLAPEPDDA